jgi:hypothetical protein
MAFMLLCPSVSISPLVHSTPELHGWVRESVRLHSMHACATYDGATAGRDTWGVRRVVTAQSSSLSRCTAGGAENSCTLSLLFVLSSSTTYSYSTVRPTIDYIQVKRTGAQRTCACGRRQRRWLAACGRQQRRWPPVVCPANARWQTTCLLRCVV